METNKKDENVVSTAKLNVWKETVDTTISTLMSKVLGFVYVVVLINFLPQQEVGKFFFVLAFVYLFVQVPSGIGKAVRKRVSERETGREDYGIASFVFFIVSLFLFGGLFLLSFFLGGSVVPIDVKFTTQLMVIFVALGFGCAKITRNYIAGCGYPGFGQKIMTFAGRGSMVFITAAFLWVDASAITALLARALSFYIAFAILLYYSSLDTLSLPSSDVFKELWVFCKWSIPTNILNDFYFRWDTLLLGFMVGATAVSYYDSTVRIVTFGTALAVGVSVAANVKVSGLHESGKPVLPLARDMLGVSSLLTAIVLLVAVFNSEYLLRILFGPEYTAAKWFLILMGTTQLFHGYRKQFEAVLNGIDIPKKTTGISLISVITNVLTAPLLVLQFGGIGVVISTILAEIIRFGLYQRMIKRQVGGYMLSRLFTSQIAGFLLAVTVLGGLTIAFEIQNPILLVISLSLGPAIFYSVIYLISPRFSEIITMYMEQR